MSTAGLPSEVEIALCVITVPSDNVTYIPRRTVLIIPPYDILPKKSSDVFCSVAALQI